MADFTLVIATRTTLVVAARLADGQDRRHRVRGARDTPRLAGNAARDPQALALGPLAGAAASRLAVWESLAIGDISMT